MNEWLKLSPNRRLEILKQVNNQTGLPLQAIEKDWWVTMVLKAIFTSQYALHFVFKGGTSLSKAYNLIDRFSEDIDLAIDRSFLGFEGELSKTQIKKLRKASGYFIINDFRKELNKRLLELDIPAETYTLTTNENIDDTSDPHTLELEYKTIVEQGDYLPQRVLIEIGARSLIEPSEERSIKSIIDETYDTQKFVMAPFNVSVVIPTRTFLEKAFLLHEEFQKPTKKIRYNRLTRHLYDLERLMDHPFGLEAMKDKELFQIIVNHRTRYTPVQGISYDFHTPKTLNFIPPPEVIDLWKNDYQAMRVNMFYGETLEFEALIERLRELKSRFNGQQY